MCIAIPVRIVELQGEDATVDAMGNRFKAKTSLLKDAKVGDLVLVHAGFAISKVDEAEAKETWDILSQISELSRDSVQE